MKWVGPGLSASPLVQLMRFVRKFRSRSPIPHVHVVTFRTAVSAFAFILCTHRPMLVFLFCVGSDVRSSRVLVSVAALDVFVCL